MEFTQAHVLNSAIRDLALRHRARAASLLSDLGLYPGQEFLLMELAKNGPLIQAKLADAIGCEPPSVTLMVRKLETGGYLTRQPSTSDRRASVVAITPKGKALVGRLEKVWGDLADETMAGVDMPLDDVATLLTRLADNVRRHDIPLVEAT